jgi:PAS domain S-box-containing protein
MSTFDLIGEAVLSTHSDAIIEAGRDGIIGFWNPGAERIFGFTSQEAIGHSLDLIIPERLRQRHWDGYDKTLRTGKAATVPATCSRYRLYARMVQLSPLNLPSCL